MCRWQGRRQEAASLIPPCPEPASVWPAQWGGGKGGQVGLPRSLAWPYAFFTAGSTKYDTFCQLLLWSSVHNSHIPGPSLQFIPDQSLEGGSVEVCQRAVSLIYQVVKTISKKRLSADRKVFREVSHHLALRENVHLEMLVHSKTSFSLLFIKFSTTWTNL